MKVEVEFGDTSAKADIKKGQEVVASVYFNQDPETIDALIRLINYMTSE